MRLLGCSRDLTDFDFKKGVFVELSAKVLIQAVLISVAEVALLMN